MQNCVVQGDASAPLAQANDSDSDGGFEPDSDYDEPVPSMDFVVESGRGRERVVILRSETDAHLLKIYREVDRRLDEMDVQLLKAQQATTIATKKATGAEGMIFSTWVVVFMSIMILVCVVLPTASDYLATYRCKAEHLKNLNEGHVGHLGEWADLKPGVDVPLSADTFELFWPTASELSAADALAKARKESSFGKALFPDDPVSFTNRISGVGVSMTSLDKLDGYTTVKPLPVVPSDPIVGVDQFARAKPGVDV